MSCQPTSKSVHSAIQSGHHLSEQVGSDEHLPPPNKFKKNRDLKVIIDPEHLSLIQKYKRIHRRAAVELDKGFSISPSWSHELNAEDWRPVVQMSMS
jgi:hypothetical protein